MGVEPRSCDKGRRYKLRLVNTKDYFETWKTTALEQFNTYL